MERDPIAVCPNEEEILRWSCGHYVDSPRHDEIEAHLAVCPSCGVNLDIAQGVTAYLLEEEAEIESAEPTEQEARRYADIARTVKHHQEQAHRLLEQEPKRWAEALMAHPDREEPDFLWQVADRAVWYADEEPDTLLTFVTVMRPHLRGLPELSTERRAQIGNALALLGLAEGVALKTKGDHRAALRCYDDAERYLGDRPGSHEYARISLARAASLRLVNRLDEARMALQIARQVFARLTDVVGEGKALWQLANIACQAGEPRRGFHLACAAHRRLLRAGERNQATMVLQTIALALIALRHARPAGRILDFLSRQDLIARNPHERARVTWQRAEAAMLEEGIEGAADLFEEAAALFAAAGVPRSAACAMLDLAHAAGTEGDIRRQADAAQRALSWLVAIHDRDTEVALAIAELGAAISAGARLAEVVATHRRRLRLV